jgi:hypothetical protein
LIDGKIINNTEQLGELIPNYRVTINKEECDLNNGLIKAQIHLDEYFWLKATITHAITRKLKENESIQELTQSSYERYSKPDEK